MQEQNNQFVLPISVISPTDIARLIRELENLDEYLRQTAIRQGAEALQVPRYSRLLDEIVVTNHIDLVQNVHREALLAELKMLETKAPILHISFSVDPPGAYIQKIVGWLRENVHPVALVRVGLQPNIGAGCVVRTTNKSFDFSLRQFFNKKRQFFVDKLHESLAEDLSSADPAQSEVTGDSTEQTTQEESIVNEGVAA
jgi:hypothetical protein